MIHHCWSSQGQRSHATQMVCPFARMQKTGERWTVPTSRGSHRPALPHEYLREDERGPKPHPNQTIFSPWSIKTP